MRNGGDTTMKRISFKDKCLAAGIDPRKGYDFKRGRKDLTDEQVIAEYIAYQNNNLREKFKKAGIEKIPPSIYKYRKMHPELTDDQIVERYLHRIAIVIYND